MVLLHPRGRAWIFYMGAGCWLTRKEKSPLQILYMDRLLFLSGGQVFLRTLIRRLFAKETITWNNCFSGLLLWSSLEIVALAMFLSGSLGRLSHKEVLAFTPLWHKQGSANPSVANTKHQLCLNHRQYKKHKQWFFSSEARLCSPDILVEPLLSSHILACGVHFLTFWSTWNVLECRGMTCTLATLLASLG